MLLFSSDFIRAAEVGFWRFSSRKLFLNSWNILRKMNTTKRDLSTIVPATLLKSLSVMGNFLVVFQEFNKNSF